MLVGFSALNESSYLDTTDGSSIETEEVPEYQDEDFISMYTEALSEYGREKFLVAEKKFRNLLASDYFKRCGWASEKPRTVAVKLQYNSYRYLGFCLSKTNSYDECLDCLENAIKIDSTDRTLYFKFAVFATKGGRLHQARSALEASMILEHPAGKKTTYPNVQHWPTLDLLISLTYKLGDYITSLRYIELALLDDDKYEKGLRVRDKIYKECPYLHPDPSKHNDESIIETKIETLPRKTKTVEIAKLRISAFQLVQLGASLVQEYEKNSEEAENLLNPCTMVFEKKDPPTESSNTPEVMEVDDDDVKILEDVCGGDAEEKEVEVPLSQQVVQSILDELVSDVTRPSTEEFLQSIIMDCVTTVVETSTETPVIFSRRRTTAASSFLHEVPLDLLEIRRSSRGKGAYDDTKGGDMTARSLLESFLPDALKAKEAFLAETKKNSTECNTADLNQSSEKPESEAELISDEEEAQVVEDLMKSSFENEFLILDGICDFLTKVVEKFSKKKWSVSLSDIFLRCYLSWRRHTVLPEDEHHPFVELMIVANEIVLAEAYNRPNGESTEEEVDEEMTEFLDADLDHLKFRLFDVAPNLSIRIFSLHIQFYKWQDLTAEAISISGKMKDFIEKFSTPETERSFSPIQSYQLIDRQNIESFLDSMKTTSMISKVSTLFDEKNYETVKAILSSYLVKKKRKSQTSGTDLRFYHLSIMIDTLWNLEDYPGCMAWCETALHEMLETRDRRLKDGAVDNAEGDHDDNEASEDIINMIKMIECCAAMLDGSFSGLDSVSKPRLAKNLLQLIVAQVDSVEKEELKSKTVISWVLLYKLIVGEENQLEIEDEENWIPGSLEFLCSAHDYLGPLGLCTVDSGQVLRLLIEKCVNTLLKFKGQKTIFDHFCKHVDQALYCLYAHPNKKSKLKHLVDHGVPNVAFTWEQSLSPYLFLRPKMLPEFDDFKSNSISVETMTFFKRIVAVIPDSFDIEARGENLVKYLKKDTDHFPRFPKQNVPRDEEFPRLLRDLFYLLADHFFKNNEFSLALKYYRIDLTINAQRVDSWFAMALALGNSLEPKINETMKDSKNALVKITSDVVKQILSDAEEVMRCFKLCIRLSPTNTTIRIESANFSYLMSSFCIRCETDVENMSMELFTRIEKLKQFFLNFAFSHYTEALKMMESHDENSLSSDERWLLFLMRGKILSKKKQNIEDVVSEYLNSIDNLVSQGASPLPKKISFNTPPELALELLEVYYRIHVTILKEEFSDDFPPSKERVAFFLNVLKKVENFNLFESKAAKDERSMSSEVDTLLEAPQAKAAKLDDDFSEKSVGLSDKPVGLSDKVEEVWQEIARKCLLALETVAERFPHHFKALHRLSSYHLKSDRNKDLAKVQRYLWGTDSSSKIASLFGERKSNNLFNGIWRLPISEFDRPGNFSTHMAKCTTSLLDMASELKDSQILYDVAWHLRKPADGDRKYLFERDRTSLEKQALTLMRRVLKEKTVDILSEKPTNDSDQALKDEILVKQGKFLVELHQYFIKVKKWWHAKDETIAAAMTDIYARIAEKSSVTLEDTLSFCQKMMTLEKGPSSGSKRSIGSVTDSPQPSVSTPQSTLSMIKSAKEFVSSPSSARSASKDDSAKAGSSQAAVHAYVNQYFEAYNDMVLKMMTGNSAGGISPEAYLGLAQYANLVSQNSLSLSPAKTAKPAQKKPKVQPSSSALTAIKKFPGSVSKPMQRKSLDPKLVAAARNPVALGSIKPHKPVAKKPGTYGSTPVSTQQAKTMTMTPSQFNRAVSTSLTKPTKVKPTVGSAKSISNPDLSKLGSASLTISKSGPQQGAAARAGPSVSRPGQSKSSGPAFLKAKAMAQSLSKLQPNTNRPKVPQRPVPQVQRSQPKPSGSNAKVDDDDVICID